MMYFFSSILSSLIALCYRFLGSYVVAIILFTALTKIILFPIALWTHRNGIKMVELTPELNELKIRHFGDQDTIAEETQALYKRRGYHPLLSTVPLFIQLALLIGVIGAVRGMLAGTESVLSRLPSAEGGAFLLVPVLAGLAALALGLAQNHLNPLQREQSPASQWGTNGFSIAISLALGVFVPIGVGIYWIFSNLFTIPQQLVLNAVMPPERYVDYEALKKSKAELAAINGLSAGVSGEDRQREKADYKRFFSVANKHLVFYSEGSGFYKYFSRLIGYLLEHSNLTIHYVTSDPKDQIFRIAEKEGRIRPYYIGEKRLITLMMKMDADIVVMTMPDLENYHIKRSYVRQDVEYIYMFHGCTSTHMVIREKALDHYDTVFCPGPYQIEEIRRADELRHLPPKKLVETGYGLIEDLADAYKEMPGKEDGRLQVLIAPSYQADNIMDSCIDELLGQLLGQVYRVIVRPHPQYIRRTPQKIEAFAQKYKEELAAGEFEFQTDFAAEDTVYRSDIVVTDWSTIAYEFSFTTGRPTLFIDTPMKVVNPDYGALGMEPLDISLRSKIGRALPLSDAARAGEAVREMLANAERYREQILKTREDIMPLFGQSAELGGKYILAQLTSKKGGERK